MCVWSLNTLTGCVLIRFRIALLFLTVLSPEGCAAQKATPSLPSEELQGEDMRRHRKMLLDEEDELSVEEELKADLERIKHHREMDTTTTTKPPPKNVVLDAGKEVGMGFWNGLLAPFRLAKDLTKRPGHTVDMAIASTVMTTSKLRNALAATIKWENAGHHWRELFRDMIRASTFHPGRQEEIERLVRLKKAQVSQNSLHVSEHANQQAERRVESALRAGESRREEERREFQKQKERYEKYKQMREQSRADTAEASAAGSNGQDNAESGTGEQPLPAVHGENKDAGQ
ncbi:hypothetical protein TGRH88_022350 [Toxoplasma gondii]|uniref:Transmembrane protein n=1 Tax=Toxoplasma gondii TaxID=5811 RepID=A0A7J6KH26_TOXGO|nr:hypothetical protein TGRH88_022350 [Toxoplasma gondii]